MQLADVVASQLGVANRARQTLRHLRQTTLGHVDVSQQSRVKLYTHANSDRKLTHLHFASDSTASGTNNIVIFIFIRYNTVFPLSALTLLVGRREGHSACKKLDVGLLVVTI